MSPISMVPLPVAHLSLTGHGSAVQTISYRPNEPYDIICTPLPYDMANMSYICIHSIIELQCKEWLDSMILDAISSVSQMIEFK